MKPASRAPSWGNSTSLLGLPVLAELASHLASVLIKVGNQVGDCSEKNSTEVVMVIVSYDLSITPLVKSFAKLHSFLQGPFNSIPFTFTE